MKHVPVLAVLVLAGVLSGGQDRAGPRSKAVHLRTAYLVQPISLEGLAPAHRITISGTLGQPSGVTLTADGNYCSLNSYGDPVVCTEMAPWTQRVTTSPLRLSDKLQLGRDAFSIGGLEGKTQLILIRPGDARSAYRLLVGDGNGNVVRVITMEPAPR